MTRATDDIMRNTRRGFTLIELMVAVAVLMGLMAMITMIFSSASKASGQAQASTALYRVVSQLAENIRQDLEAMEPSSSILGVARVDVPAYLTIEDLQSGRSLNQVVTDPTNDLHRADVLMLVTQRKFEPYVYQAPAGVDFDSVRHVVYGHANFGTLNAAGTDWASKTNIEPATAGEPSPLPASRWVLAKRTIGFPVGICAPLTGTNVASWPLIGGAFTGNDPGKNVFADVYKDGNFASVLAVRTLTGSTGGGTYKLRTDTGTPLECFEDQGTNGVFFADSSSSLRLYNKYWWKWGSGKWTRTEPVGTPIDLLPPLPAPPDLLNFYKAGQGGDWRQWFYEGGDTRTRLDRSPPATRSDLMACYFMPGCVDFKVEFTYDNPREIVLDPTATSREPLVTDKFDVNTGTWLDTNGDNTCDKLPIPQAINWQSVPKGETWVWSHLLVTPSYYKVTAPALDLRDQTLQSPESGTPLFTWPRAIRITLRAVDPAGRLAEPITQTIVHTFK